MGRHKKEATGEQTQGQEQPKKRGPKPGSKRKKRGAGTKAVKKVSLEVSALIEEYAAHYKDIFFMLREQLLRKVDELRKIKAQHQELLAALEKGKEADNG